MLKVVENHQKNKHKRNILICLIFVYIYIYIEREREREFVCYFQNSILLRTLSLGIFLLVTYGIGQSPKKKLFIAFCQET